MIIRFNTGDPPEVGRYIVTDGEEVDMDSWLEYTGTRVRLPSDVGKPGEDVYRRCRASRTSRGGRLLSPSSIPTCYSY